MQVNTCMSRTAVVMGLGMALHEESVIDHGIAAS